MNNPFKNHFFPKVLVFICICGLLSCSSPSPKVEIIASKFEDKVLQQIADFQDARNTGDLLIFMTDENPKYRAAAALAFGSVQDSLALPQLYELLGDESVEVKISAAYAIGQTKDTTASSALINAIEMTENSEVLKAELEALGKVTTSEDLIFFETFKPSDSTSKSGLAWGIYRAGLRGKFNEVTISKAADLLSTSNSNSTRLGASHFFGRVRNLNISGAREQLEKTLKSDPHAEVRMGIAIGLRNINDQSKLIPLLLEVINNSDYRVRINAINALSIDIFDLIKEDIARSLNDENVNVGITAASYLGKSENVQWLYDLAKSQENWRIRYTLLNAAYDLADGEVANEIQSTFLQSFESSQNGYEKAWIVRGLSKKISSTEFLASQAFNSANARVIRSYAIQGLGQLRRHEEFSADWENTYAEIFKRAMMSGDLVMVFVSSAIFQNPDFNYKSYFPDTDWMTETRNNLDPIEDWEIIHRIDETIAFFIDEEIEEVEQVHHPIDWEYFYTFPPNQQVVIKTSKGDIIIQMKFDQAPSSATNFLKLAAEGFYDSIYFHRVVPNFVVQGGCPRGDGWGGVNYAIRSEIGPSRYKTGSVGMASSGKDTEGTQWFITHSPAPHLNGGYSIFAEVVEGMDIVNSIEVGDKIISVRPIE